MDAMLHDWRIEDREYARQEERRGRRHAFQTLEPARPAAGCVHNQRAAE